jgi:hypothetical protein
VAGTSWIPIRSAAPTRIRSRAGCRWRR